jgi:hypothetical protein
MTVRTATGTFFLRQPASTRIRVTAWLGAADAPTQLEKPGGMLSGTGSLACVKSEMGDIFDEPALLALRCVLTKNG